MKQARVPSDNAMAYLREFGEGRTLLSFAEGENIYAEGETANAVYFVSKGKVKLTVVSPSGKEAVIGLLSATDFFGEGCLSGQLLRMSSAIALTSCVVMKLDRGFLIARMQLDAALTEFVLSYMVARIHRIELDLIDQLFNSSEKRLARVLLLLANAGPDGKPANLIENINQETLAEIVGTTRSRVSYFMNKFRRLGLIEYNGCIRVHSSLAGIIRRD